MDRIPNQQRIDLRPTAKAPMRAPARLSPVVIVLAGLLLIAVSVAGYFYWQYRNSKPGVAEAKETKALTETIGELMLLPEGEEPTLATVTDREKLADQPFFQKAENGDKVLIYSNSGRAILYRPSQKKIVDVTAVNVAPPAGDVATSANNIIPNTVPQTAPGAATPDTLRVAIFNASGQLEASNEMEKVIKNFYPKANIMSKQVASATYDDTFVSDITGKNETLSESLSFAIKGKVALFPEEQKKPDDADVAVFIGKKH